LDNFEFDSKINIGEYKFMDNWWRKMR
jgi:hypothetical protein